jgi:DEAD/DEAH box helicase domain-containing protein
MTDVADRGNAPTGIAAPGVGGATRPVIERVLDDFDADPRLLHVRRIPARAPEFGDLSSPLPRAVRRGVPHDRLWSHQARAVDLIRSGCSVAIATGTASGKSLCYQLPIAEAAIGGATSLLVFPTKALAQDQLLSFAAWNVPGVLPATYDGDCTPEERAWVRDNANVLLTNPEMLHHAMLPNHRRWGSFLRRLRFVVVDELHTLRGVFGTHVAHVLRRLRRLVLHHGGAEPVFVFTSATIGDPGVLASELSGLDVQVVDHSGAPGSQRTVALWNPAAALPEERDRYSVHDETATIAAHLIASGLRTLVFCRSRRSTELIAAGIRSGLSDETASLVRSYRAGYLASERREIEAELFGGTLRGVVATNALELGVDIGGLDAVVLSGYPGTIASFWQQVGRGGRSDADSLAVLVAGEDQLDQWMMRNPDELFERGPEPAVVNGSNPYVYVPHLGCAAHEVPLRHSDARYWPHQLDDGIRSLVLEDRATVRPDRHGPSLVWSGRGVPAPTISLRSASRGQFRILDTDGRPIGTVDEARAFEVVHPGAIYLHQGTAWAVVDLDPDERVATVELSDGDTYTQARTDTTIELVESDAERSVGAATLRLGSVDVTSRVVGYQVRSTSDHEVVSRELLELPSTQLCTRAVWYSFEEQLVEAAGVTPAQLPGALHAAEHAAIGILPLFTICDRWDVGGVSTEWLPETGRPTIVIHDAYPGGAGIAELAFEASDRHLSATLEVLLRCTCADGCPSCVQSPKCGNNNEPLDRDAAARLLAATFGI